MLLCIVCLEHLNNIETTPLFIPFQSRIFNLQRKHICFKGTFDSQGYAISLINIMSNIVSLLASKLFNSYNVLLYARSRNALVIFTEKLQL